MRGKVPASTTSLLIMAVCLVGASSAEPGGMTLKQVSEVRSYTSVSVSPDGSLVAAVRRVPRTLFEEDDGPAWSELMVVDTASGSVRPFITGNVNIQQVSWLPDGSAISFVARREGDAQANLYLIPVDGGESKKVLDLDSGILGYDWSPDGTRIAAIARQVPSDAEKKLRERGFNQAVFEEDWLPNEVWLARTGDRANTPRRLELTGSAFQVAWSPGGDRLAIATAPRSLVDDRYMYQQVSVVDADSGEVTGMVDHEGKLGDVEWSPDGTQLAIISGIHIHDPAAASLFVVPAAGGVPSNRTLGFAGSVHAARWLDDDTLVFLGDVGVTTDLFTVSADGGSEPQATGRLDGDVVFTQLELADDHSIVALLGSSPSFPAEVFSGRVDRGSPRRLTDSNPWLADVRLAPQEAIRHQARDGLELEGILIHPLDEAEGTRYPLVMIVHGGPETHRRDGWQTTYSSPAQVLAGRGFAVFLPNYRGSTGRGVEFSMLSQADPAGAEFDDLVDAVDHLIDIGLVDRDRVGITGGSYGGYATAWCSTRYSDRFAAGVMFVGISNTISKYGTTDIPMEELLVHARRQVYDDFDFALSRSPITHTRGAGTPLLILHGTDDPRVSVTQSKEMYRALKTTTDTPVRLVLYPGEEHGNRRAASRYDCSIRLLRWMEHYLELRGEGIPPYSVDYRSQDYGWPATDD